MLNIFKKYISKNSFNFNSLETSTKIQKKNKIIFKNIYFLIFFINLIFLQAKIFQFKLEI